MFDTLTPSGCNQYTLLSFDLQVQLIRKFLFADFIQNFRRFFQFKKQRIIFTDVVMLNSNLGHEDCNKSHVPYWKRFSKYPYHDWHEQKYLDFMISFLGHLEVRQFNVHEQIISELDESSELYFV